MSGITGDLFQTKKDATINEMKDQFPGIEEQNIDQCKNAPLGLQSDEVEATGCETA